MIKSALHFFKIHREMIFGNTSIVVQNMFRKTPKSLNTVNVIFRSFIDQCFRMAHSVMLAKTFERVVTPKGISIVDRSLPCLLPDDGHEFFFTHMLNNSCINPSIAFQKAENDALASCATSSLSFTPAAKVGLVQLDLAFQFFTFELCHMIDRLTQMLVYPTDRLIVQIQIARKTIRRLL